MIWLIITLKVLLDIVLGVIGVGFLLLVIPVEYSIDAKVDDVIRATARVATLWDGLFVLMEYQPRQASVEMRLVDHCFWRMNIHPEHNLENSPDNSKREDVHAKTQGARAKRRALRKKAGSKRKLTDFLQREFLRDVGSFLKSMVRMVKPRHLELRGTYGFEDPSWTGILCGILPMVSLIVPFSDIALEPEFEEETIDVTAHIDGKVVPVALLARVLRLILRKSIRRVLFRRRKKTKKMKLLASDRV